MIHTYFTDPFFFEQLGFGRTQFLFGKESGIKSGDIVKFVSENDNGDPIHILRKVVEVREAYTPELVIAVISPGPAQ